MTKPVSIAPDALRGRRILVVEDEYMIAEEVALTLSDAGADVIGPVSRMADAMQLLADGGSISAALLDVNLGTQAIWPLVDALLGRHVPLVLTTGYDAAAIPAEYAHLPRCEKPASERDIRGALASVLAKDD